MRNPTPWFGSTDQIFKVWRDLIGETLGAPFSPTDWIKTDSYQTDREWVYMMAIPDLTPDHQFDVRVQGGSLHIKGESREVRNNSAARSHYQSEMSFNYVVPLPNHLNVEKMTTDLNDRVLTIRIPKKGKR